MPGSTPATSQLDWLSSTTAMIVLSWSKATRDLLKSFSWGIGALRQLFASDDGAISFAACPIPSLRWREMDSNLRFPNGARARTICWHPRPQYPVRGSCSGLLPLSSASRCYPADPSQTEARRWGGLCHGPRREATEDS